MRTRAAIPARSAMTSPSLASLRHSLRRKTTSCFLSSYFDDNGSGVGGTANYNTFQYASENSDAIASVTKAWGKHELAAGFEYMKRFLNVGQPIAPSGEYSFNISATDQSVSSATGGSDFASLLIGMGEAAGQRNQRLPQLLQGSV